MLYTAAQSLQKLGSVDQAVEFYGRLADRSENDPWRLVGRSARQLTQDDANGALESANQAVSIASGMPEAHYQLGRLLMSGGKAAEAREHFHQALKADPGLTDARRSLERLSEPVGQKP